METFSKRHYAIPASAMKDVKITVASYDGKMSPDRAVEWAIRNLADILGRDNPKFDRERFLKACGL